MFIEVYKTIKRFVYKGAYSYRASLTRIRKSVTSRRKKTFLSLILLKLRAIMNGLCKAMGYVNRVGANSNYYKLIYWRLKQICYDYKNT